MIFKETGIAFLPASPEYATVTKWRRAEDGWGQLLEPIFKKMQTRILLTSSSDFSRSATKLPKQKSEKSKSPPSKQTHLIEIPVTNPRKLKHIPIIHLHRATLAIALNFPHLITFHAPLIIRTPKERRTASNRFPLIVGFTLLFQSTGPQRRVARTVCVIAGVVVYVRFG